MKTRGNRSTVPHFLERLELKFCASIWLSFETKSLFTLRILMSINYHVYISFWNETRFLYVQGKWLIHTCTLDGMPTKLASSSSGEPPIKKPSHFPCGACRQGSPCGYNNIMHTRWRRKTDITISFCSTSIPTLDGQNFDEHLRQWQQKDCQVNMCELKMYFKETASRTEGTNRRSCYKNTGSHVY
jgi:hypothetical protein